MTSDLESISSPFAIPRDFLQNRFVYVTVSPRAKGLSVGVDMNPDKLCNFDCVYCEVNRLSPAKDTSLEIDAMAAELQDTLDLIRKGGLHELPLYQSLPENLLQLRHVSLSGDGEPTLCPNFIDAVHAVLHLRALSRAPFFKVVLITNSSGLDRAEVQEGLRYFTRNDEIWAKLDAGTEAYMRRINRTDVPLQKILDNILLVAKKRPVVIQGLFALVDGEEPPPSEIEAFAQRLLDLKNQGAEISLVQIYSATRPICNANCDHLPLRRLSQIATTVRLKTGLRVEIY